MNLKQKQESIRLAAIDFANGSNIKDVMSKYNVCYASVYNALKKYNIDYKYIYKPNIHSLNEDYFEVIDTEHKAYWLGFIMADGTVIKSSSKVSSHNRLKITLSMRDEEHLIEFKKDINSTANIKYYIATDNYKSCYINIDSIKLVSDLIKLNCIPNKTNYTSIPNIPNNLLNHFIRGYFDGDGSISVYYQNGRNDKRCHFSITSNSNILLEIQNILINNCNLNKTKLKSYKSTNVAKSLTYGGTLQVKRIYEYLYKDSTIYLKRKYDKFNQLFS